MLTPIPTNAVFGLLAAIFWGGGDFSGGMGAKHTGGTIGGALSVILVSHSASLSILAALALLRGDTFPHGTPLIWAIAAGVVGGLSLLCFYVALARGAMGTTAAISGLLAAGVPAIVALISEGSPGPLRMVGFLAAGAAIWIVAAAPTGVLEVPPKSAPSNSAASTVLLAVFAGTGFGAYFVALKMAGAAGVFWPMATVRIGSIVTCGIFLLALRIGDRKRSTENHLTRPAVLWALAATMLDTGGNLLFISATRAGRLDVAAVLASLYPATTILLAGLILKERFSRRQKLGMAIAAVAVVIIAL